MTQTLDEKIAKARYYLSAIGRIPDERWYYTNRLHDVCDPDTIRAILDALDEARRHVEVLQEKISAETSCACGYDTPDDVCAVHSPALKAARAENARLREALEVIAEIADEFGESDVLVTTRLERLEVARAALEGK